jgi:hypothetical protein
LAAAASFLCAATYSIALWIIQEIRVYPRLEVMVLSIIFHQWAAVLALGLLVLAGARGGITATHRKNVDGDVPMGTV